MTSINCLEGIRCPVCGNGSRFYISCICLATVTDDGVEGTEDHEWDDWSYICCAECRHDADLDCFRGAIDAPLALRHVLETIVRPYSQLLDAQMLPRDAEMLRRLLARIEAPQTETANA